MKEILLKFIIAKILYAGSVQKEIIWQIKSTEEIKLIQSLQFLQTSPNNFNHEVRKKETKEKIPILFLLSNLVYLFFILTIFHYSNLRLTKYTEDLQFQIANFYPHVVIYKVYFDDLT